MKVNGIRLVAPLDGIDCIENCSMNDRQSARLNRRWPRCCGGCDLVPIHNDIGLGGLREAEAEDGEQGHPVTASHGILLLLRPGPPYAKIWNVCPKKVPEEFREISEKR